jgi:hypothetical protein
VVVLERRVGIGGLTTMARAAVLLLAGGCALRPAFPRSVRAADRSPVELLCDRTADSVLRVTLRNRAGRPQDVDLLGLAFAGHSGGSVNRHGVLVRGEMWDHWWTQHGVRLAPHGQWSAYFYIHRIEKIEARDRFGRVLAHFDVRKLPDHHWDTFAALHRRADWQPFRRAEPFGQRVPDLRWHGAINWRTITPAALPRCALDLEFVRPRVIGDVSAGAFTAEQRAGLRGRVERRATLIVCGGPDLGRLHGWEQAGLLAAPVRGTGVVPACRSLAQRYGVPPLLAPLPVADVGVVAPPARVALAEGGVPLVIERPLGAGLLILLTFDPTRPPFRGSAIERPFWQEWLGREAVEFEDAGFAPEASPAFERVRRQLSLLPPSLGALTGIWLGYLAALLLVLVAARRRARALVALSFGASLAALAMGPALRGVHPAAAYARSLHLLSGDDEGWWWGRADLMLPRTGLVSVNVPNGWNDSFWDAPRIRPAGAPAGRARPLFRRWVSQGSGLDGIQRLPGRVDFLLEWEGERLFARVQNHTHQPVRDLTIVWGSAFCLRLPDLAPGGEARGLLARIGSSGQRSGAHDAPPAVYGPIRSNGGPVDPLLLHPPVLLARAPVAPPRLLADGRLITMRGETTLMVMPAGCQARGAFHLAREIVSERLVTAQGPYGRWGRQEWGGRLTLEPGARATLEMELPAGAGRARWRSLSLLLDMDAALTARLQVFDWSRQQWVPAARFQGHGPPSPPPRFFPQQVPEPVPMSSPGHTISLPSPGQFVNPTTDTILVRIETEGASAGGVDLGIRGDGQRR